jgi:cleavage stimulation factor subunit 3
LTSVADEATELQLQLWRKLVEFERSNPLELSREAHADSMRLLLAQRAACAPGRHCPELWLEYMLFELESSDSAATEALALDRARAVLAEGSAALPGSAALALAAADVLEQRRLPSAATAAYTVLLEALHAIADRGVAATPSLSAVEAALASDALAVPPATLLATAEDASRAADAIPLVYILYQRHARRCGPAAPAVAGGAGSTSAVEGALAPVGGIEAARAVFAKARKSRHCNAQVYLASARLEFSANGALAVARNVIEAGRKRFSTDVSFALSAAGFLCAVDDAASARAFLEAALHALPPACSRPVFDRAIAFELAQLQDGSAALAKVAALERRRLAAHPHLAAAPSALAGALHRLSAFGMVPAASRADDAFLRRSAARAGARESIFLHDFAEWVAVVRGSDSADVAPGGAAAEVAAAAAATAAAVPAFLRPLVSRLAAAAAGEPPPLPPPPDVDALVRALGGGERAARKRERE